jgi:hypothetical protein
MKKIILLFTFIVCFFIAKAEKTPISHTYDYESFKLESTIDSYIGSKKTELWDIVENYDEDSTHFLYTPDKIVLSSNERTFIFYITKRVYDNTKTSLRGHNKEERREIRKERKRERIEGKNNTVIMSVYSTDFFFLDVIMFNMKTKTLTIYDVDTNYFISFNTNDQVNKQFYR